MFAAAFVRIGPLSSAIKLIESTGAFWVYLVSWSQLLAEYQVVTAESYVTSAPGNVKQAAHMMCLAAALPRGIMLVVYIVSQLRRLPRSPHRRQELCKCSCGRRFDRRCLRFYRTLFPFWFLSK